jgi:hypothetical protein
VSGYGLDDREIEVQSSAQAKDFSSILCVQTSSETHPASNPVGIGGPFPGAKVQLERDTDHSPPFNAEVKNEYELYFLSPQAPSWCVVRQLQLFSVLFLAFVHPVLPN